MMIVNGITKSEHSKLHMRLLAKFGKASKCEMPDCKSDKPKRFEWALKKGSQYSDKREDYIQMCPSCHRKYDFTEDIRKKLKDKKQGEKHNAAKLKEADVIGIYYFIVAGIENKEIARMYNVDPSTVSDIKRGKRWPHTHLILKRIQQNNL